MRTKPILGKKLWFEPRGWGGWGWTPVSWEGWVVVVVFVVVTVATANSTLVPTFLVVPALLLVCWLKGTSPGGPAARRRLEIQRERERDR